MQNTTNADRSRPRVCALALGLALAFSSAAGAATPSDPNDWTGVWKRVGSIAFDPANKPETRENPPYRPDWQARYEVALKSAERGQFNADPTASCVPPGMPRLMNMVYPMEIIQKPDQLTIVAEWESQVRRIFLDGRPHPQDMDATFNGHSVGHWEGKTLVVDTVGLRADTVFDQSGIRHSDKLHIVERFTLTAPDTLIDELSADDPVAFFHPWVVKKTYKRTPGEQMQEYVCEENNRNPIGADGAPTTILKAAGR